MEKRLEEYLLDSIEKKAIYIELVRAVFAQAYRDGRDDGVNGIFIDCDLALQIFLDREGNGCSILHRFECLK